MATRGNPLHVKTGPGRLYVATLGSEDPVSEPALASEFDAPWPEAWTSLGYTEEGSSSAYETSFDPVEVAEELEQLDDVPTGRTITVDFSLAERTAENLRLAMNGGTIIETGTAGESQVVRFDPPDLGAEVLVMLGFEAEDGSERAVWRQCKQTGSVETARRKGADKALIPCSFRVYRPATGATSFSHWFRPVVL